MNRIRFKALLTGIATIVIIIYLIFFHEKTLFSTGQKNMCKAKNKALNVEFSGILIRKYEDKSDHLIKKIDINSAQGTYNTSFLASEVSGFFDKLVVGDSLMKEKNSLEVLVLRNGKIEKYSLDYLCKN